MSHVTPDPDFDGATPDLIIAFLELYDGVLFPPIIFMFMCALAGSLLNALFNYFHLEKSYREQFWVTKKNTEPVVVRSATGAHVVVTPNQTPPTSTPVGFETLHSPANMDANYPSPTPSQGGASSAIELVTTNPAASLLAHAAVDYGGTSVTSNTILLETVETPCSPSSPPPSSEDSFNSYDAEERDQQLSLLPKTSNTKAKSSAGQRSRAEGRGWRSEAKTGGAWRARHRVADNDMEDSGQVSGVGSPLAATPTIPPTPPNVLSSDLSSGIVADRSVSSKTPAKRRYLGPVLVKESLENEQQPNRNSSFASGISSSFAASAAARSDRTRYIAASANADGTVPVAPSSSLTTPITSTGVGHPFMSSPQAEPLSPQFIAFSPQGIVGPPHPSTAADGAMSTTVAITAGSSSPLPHYIGNANEMEAVNAKAKQHAIQQSRTRERKEVIQWVIMSTSDAYFTVSLVKTLLMIVYFGYHFNQKGGMERLLVLSAAYYAGGALSPAILLMMRYVLPLRHIEGTLMSEGGIRGGAHQAIHSPAQYSKKTATSGADSSTSHSRMHVALGVNEASNEWFTIDMLFTPNFDVEGLWNCFNQGATFVTVGCVVLPAFLIFTLLAWCRYFWFFATPIVVLALSRKLYYASLVARPPAVDLVYYCMYRSAMLTSMAWMLQTGFIFGSIYLVGNTKSAAPIEAVLHAEGRSAYLSLPVAELSMRFEDLGAYFEIMGQTYFGTISMLSQMLF